MTISNEVVRKPWWRRLRTGMSLRVLMGLVLVIGGGLGWVVHRARVQRQAVAAIEAAGGKVYYEWSSFPPKWLLASLGPDYFGNVIEVQIAAWKSKADDANGVNLSRNGLSEQAVTEFGPGCLHHREVLRTTLADARLDAIGAAWVDQDLAHVTTRPGAEQPS